jgi:hypothetical protein
MNKILVGILLSNLLFSCNEKNKKTEKNEIASYASPAHHMSFDYPKNWNLSFNPDSSNPHSIIFLHEPLTDTSDTYAEEFVLQWDKLPLPISDSLNHLSTIGQFKIANQLEVKNLGELKFGTTTFYGFTMDFSPDEGKSLYQLKGFTKMKDSISYQIHLTSEIRNIEKYNVQIETILNSFKAI